MCPSITLVLYHSDSLNIIKWVQTKYFQSFWMTYSDKFNMNLFLLFFSAVDNNLIGERNAHFKRKNVVSSKNEFSFLSVYRCLSKICIDWSRYRIHDILKISYVGGSIHPKLRPVVPLLAEFLARKKTDSLKYQCIKITLAESDISKSSDWLNSQLKNPD